MTADRPEIGVLSEDVLMRALVWTCVSTLLCSGCTSIQLEQYTVNQAMSVSDMRARQVLNALAVVANSHGTLPSFALTAGGTANVTNTISIDTATLWDAAVYGFSKETLTGVGQHNPELQWTLDPVSDAPKTEALHYACLWVLIGPPELGGRPMELLRETTVDDVNGCNPSGKSPVFHFGVASRLKELPDGWLRQSPKHSVSKHVSHQATCGNTTVWVAPEDLTYLTDFALILLDIATADPASLAVRRPKVAVEILEDATQPNPLTLFQNAPPAPPEFQRTKITEQWNACQASSPLAAASVQLICSSNAANEIPTSGKNAIIITSVGGVLHFRKFNGAGEIVDKNESQLKDHVELIADLKKQLMYYWPPHVLTESQRQRVITAVATILGDDSNKTIGQITLRRPADLEHPSLTTPNIVTRGTSRVERDLTFRADLRTGQFKIGSESRTVRESFLLSTSPPSMSIPQAYRQSY
jgi:hypothetical protein